MTIEVIGAGLGRTGTLSLREGLHILGYDPCHHMSTVEPENEPPLWEEALDTPDFDWNRILGNYKAVVDWPGCHFWRRLMDFYPDAKVILTKRDPDAWYESISKT